MAAETFKKRQKEAARREKQQKKLARRLERKHEKTRMPNDSAGENDQSVEPASQHGATIF